MFGDGTSPRPAEDEVSIEDQQERHQLPGLGPKPEPLRTSLIQKMNNMMTQKLKDQSDCAATKSADPQAQVVRKMLPFDHEELENRATDDDNYNILASYQQPPAQQAAASEQTFDARTAGRPPRQRSLAKKLSRSLNRQRAKRRSMHDNQHNLTTYQQHPFAAPVVNPRNALISGLVNLAARRGTSKTRQLD